MAFIFGGSTRLSLFQLTLAFLLLLSFFQVSPAFAQYYQNYASNKNTNSQQNANLHPGIRPTGAIPGSRMNSLERALNSVESRSNWAQAPVSPAGRRIAMNPFAQMPARNVGTISAPNPAGFGGFPGFNKQDLMRIFLGGSSTAGGASRAPAPKDFSSQNSNAYNAYQRAENESSKAHGCANGASYGNDKWGRKNYADQAEYAANAAYYAAQEAQNAAYNAGSEAQGYANLARAASDRARADADRARYNADTF